MPGRPRRPHRRAARGAGPAGGRAHLDGFLELPDVEVPARLAAWAAGTPWLAELGDVVHGALAAWDLELLGVFDSGYSWVGEVRRADGTLAVLKVPWPGDDSVLEARALAAWGDGACRVLAVDGRILLLERLEPAVPTQDDDVVARALARLWVAPPPGAPWRTTGGVAARWAATIERFRAELGPEVADIAAARWRAMGDRPGDVLLHGDGHHGNVVSSARGWVVIDPQPMLGEPALDLCPALWNGPGGDAGARVDVLAAAAGVDPARLRWLAVPRAVVSAAWCHEDGLPDARDQAERSLAVARALLGTS